MNNQLPFQLPFPTFEDFRKYLSFWFDQQDKWFYFETEKLISGSAGRIMHMQPTLAELSSPLDDTQESTQYAQLRIVGQIQDVLSFPPSLLLTNTSVFTVQVSFDGSKDRILNLEKRKEYGLVFSQITYYEPIHDVAVFLQEDSRVKHRIRKGKEQ